MTLHKYYEFFKLFNKNKGDDDFKSNLKYLIDNYKSPKFNPTVEFRDNHAYVSFFYEKSMYSYMLDYKKDKYQITDCQKDVELSPEEKKRTRMDTYYLEVEISKEEYDYYIYELQKISDYLDEKSDNERTSVNSDGLNMDLSEREVTELQLDDAMSKMFNEYLNKDYEFEVLSYVCKSDSSNDKKIESMYLKIVELKLRPYLNWNEDDDIKPKFYIEIGIIHDAKDYYIHLDQDNNTQYIDLSKKLKINMMLSRDTSQITRRQEREEKNRPYPKVDFRDISASKYDTIEFLSNLKQFLETVNEKYS